MLKRSLSATTNTVLLLIVVALALYIGFGIAGRSLQLYSLKKEEARLQKEIAGLEDSITALAKEEEYLKTEAFVEKVAREELNLIKTGETAVVILQPRAVPPTEAKASEEKQREGFPNWQRWWSLFFGRGFGD